MVRYVKEDFEKAVKNNYSYSAAHKEMTGSNSGSSFLHFKKKVIELNIDTSHFSIIKVRGNNKSKTKLSWDKMLILNRIKDGRREKSHMLRRAMLEYGFESKCSNCGNPGEWMGKKMRLEIDHINNNNVDNRPDNLRFLCPNCHSIEPNVANWGTNWADKIIQDGKTNSCKNCERPILKKSKSCAFCYNSRGKTNHCLNCKKTIDKRSTRCYKCNNKFGIRKTKIKWPCSCILIEQTSNSSFVSVANELGVSDNAIRKRIKFHPCDCR